MKESTRRRNVLWLLASIAIVCLFSGQSSADTSVCGNYTTSVTWTAAASPYIVTCNINVNATGILIIEPAVTVKFKI